MATFLSANITIVTSAFITVVQSSAGRDEATIAATYRGAIFGNVPLNEYKLEIVAAFDSSGDFIDEVAASGIDKVCSSISFSLMESAHVGGEAENLVLTGTLNASGTSNAPANSITGNSGNNLLNGGAGNDALVGGAGIDKIGRLGERLRLRRGRSWCRERLPKGAGSRQNRMSGACRRARARSDASCSARSTAAMAHTVVHPAMAIGG